ncbi:hypothetical protein [Lysinibacillus sp. SGAir0095]|uniref:hypothetical protein n=1 Tax=Lysinibacillus sp. SGAir0095 TaxID=2070463 RepID=UPI0010CCE96B|nr:hypothetical protein [Lysinibacillus sp. SGAir0095]QCR33823.1 hypothetical protein C1N55_17520 [Lysinibacillus sp. SGAir0095]
MANRRTQNGNRNGNLMPPQNRIQNMDNSNVINEEEFIAKLSAMGGVISTIGGIMSTAASFLALQKFQRDIIIEEEPTGNGNRNAPKDDRISELEKQIQYLIKEIDELKDRKS